jgi:hypothetical protein
VRSGFSFVGFGVRSGFSFAGFGVRSGFSFDFSTGGAAATTSGAPTASAFTSAPPGEMTKVDAPRV